MSGRLPLLLLLPSLAFGGGVRGHAARSRTAAQGTEESLRQIQDTLHNLLRSVEDGGRDASGLYKKMGKWCDATDRAFGAEGEAARTAIAHLQMDLNERQASAEEVEGMSQQVESDMALIRRTVNQTGEMLLERRHLLGTKQSDGETEEATLAALVDNKVKTLESLEAELAVLRPQLSGLHAQAAETEQRLSDRKASEAARATFLDAVQGSCGRSRERGDAVAELRVGVSTAVQGAMQDLQLIAQTVHQPNAVDNVVASAVAEPVDGDDVGVSLVQTDSANAVADVATDDDLLAIFDGGDGGDAAEPAAPHRAEEAPLAVPRQVAQPVEIKRILAGLTAAGNASADRRVWCEQESAKNKLALRRSQDSLAQTVAEMEAHASAKAEINEDIKHLERVTAALKSARAEFTSSSGAEQTLLDQGSKDQRLAVKILQQATTILDDLKSSQLSGKAAEWVAKAVVQLTSAQKSFEMQSQGAKDRLATAAAAATLMQKTADEAMRTCAHENLHLGRDRDLHESLLAQGADSTASQQTEVSAATGYLAKLAEQCTEGKGLLAPQADKARSAEVHALQDAEKVLEGKQVAEQAPRHLSRSAAVAAKRGKSLSPMERAAAEMGIDPDDDTSS